MKLKQTYRTLTINQLWKNKLIYNNCIRYIKSKSRYYVLAYHKNEMLLPRIKTRNFISHFYFCEGKKIFISDFIVDRFIFFIVCNDLQNKTMEEAYILYRLTEMDNELDYAIQRAIPVEQLKEI